VSYNLELDTLWLKQQGMDVNQIVRVGSLLERDRSHQPYFTQGPAQVHIELQSWHILQTIGLWPVLFRFIDKPVGWNFTVKNPNFGNISFPWNCLSFKCKP
jgi:hypothetical protein